MNEYGTAGGSLGATRNADHGQWAANAGTARAGRVGEAAVAKVLAEAYARMPHVHVLHDLRLPGYSANIDHAIIGGNRVLLLDSKRWKPGFYWTLGGKTRRGRERIEWADGATMPAALRVVTEMVDKAAADQRGLGRVKVAASLLVVPGAGDGRLSMWAYRPSGGTHVKVVGAGTPRWLRSQVSNSATDLSLVGLLRSLVIDQTTVRIHGQVPSPAPRRG